jgi:hypothetical protein
MALLYKEQQKHLARKTTSTYYVPSETEQDIATWTCHVPIVEFREVIVESWKEDQVLSLMFDSRDPGRDRYPRSRRYELSHHPFERVKGDAEVSIAQSNSIAAGMLNACSIAVPK